jgi:hypothetical protein
MTRLSDVIVESPNPVYDSKHLPWRNCFFFVCRVIKVYVSSVAIHQGVCDVLASIDGLAKTIHLAKSKGTAEQTHKMHKLSKTYLQRKHADL